ncbi:MAG: gliding motility-associated C-terminal domain-containing protein [Chitinophagaceae bacterium]
MKGFYRLLSGLTALLLVCTVPAAASHLYGGEMYYTHISGRQYKVTMVLYGDCGGTASVFAALYTASPKVQVYNGTFLYRTMDLKVITAGTEITPVCPSSLSSTTCNGGTVPGVRKFVYEDTITLNVASANWKFRSTGYLTSTTSAGRSASITNILMSGSGSIMSLEATLNDTGTYNNNPTYTTVPTPFFCINTAQEYNPGAVESDLTDSLAYELVDGLDATTTPSSLVTYATGYSATAPLAVATGSFSFSKTTGQLTFTPNLAQKSLVVMKVSEYRNGVLVGTSMREMTFIVLSTCSNRSPYGKISSLAAGTLTGNTTVSICKNENYLGFEINPIDSDGNSITMTAAGLPSGATLSITGNGTTSPKSSFLWNISSVTPGTYYFYITYQDDGCPLSSKQTVAYTLTILPKATSSITLISAATCVKKAVFDIIPAAGGAPYTIQVKSAATTLHTLSGSSSSFRDSLAPGTYTVRTTNTNGCYSDTSFTLVAPANPAFASISTVMPLCFGGTNGSLTAVGSGGLSPYMYSIDKTTFAGSGTFSGLSKGSYTITLRDANYCTKDTTVSIAEPTEITSVSTSKNNVCNVTKTGAITLTASNGTPGYQYALGSGSYSAANTFTGLGSGTYTINVKDANGCTKSFPVTVGDSINVRTTVITDNVSCNKGTDGSLKLSPYLGVTPFTYALGSGSYGSSSSFTGLTAGSYVVHIKDALGCYLDTTLTITEPAALAMAFSKTSPTCNGYSDGAVTVAAAGGTTAYTYAIDGGTYSTVRTFTKLKAGKHVISVRDAKNCTLDSSIQLTEPEPILISAVLDSINCFGGADGIITVSGSGGVQPYSYILNTGSPQSSPSFTGLTAAGYKIQIADANGCLKDTDVVLAQPAKLLISDILIRHPTCEGYKDGSLAIRANGGTSPYSYALNNSGYADNNEFTQLGEGKYAVSVKDTKGCITDGEADLVGYPKITEESRTVIPTSCYGKEDGAFIFIATGGNPSLRYVLNGSKDTLTAADYANLKARNFTVTVVDSTNCYKSFTISVPQPEALQTDLDVTHNDCTGLDTNGRIIAKISGGTAPYSYIWSYQGDTDSFISGLANGYYTVWITDAHQCKDSVTQEIYYDNCCTPSIPNAFTPNGDGRNDVIRILYKGDIILKEFSIYNRYGQQVFTTDNIDQGWDGRFLGREEELGVYYYYVKLVCGNQHSHVRTFKGDITLIR